MAFSVAHDALHLASCSLVHASALPLIGVIPGCLAALISLVRFVVATVFFLVAMIALPTAVAFVPDGHNKKSIGALAAWQTGAQREAYVSGVFLVRSLLCIASGGFFGFAFERLSNRNYAQVTGTPAFPVAYNGYNDQPIWFA